MMSPDQMLAQFKANANSRKARSLDILSAVCQEQFERGSKDFTIATIGRLSLKKGGPATQSIRNKSGAEFKALITAWANQSGPVVKRQPKLNEHPLFAVLEKIPDPAVRAVMGAILAENKKLKGEVNLLKCNSQIVIDRRPAPWPACAEAVLPKFDGLTDTEKLALHHSISDRLLQDEGWHLDESGRILSDRGRVIFKIGFRSAIRKILASIDQ